MSIKDLLKNAKLYQSKTNVFAVEYKKGMEDGFVTRYYADEDVDEDGEISYWGLLTNGKNELQLPYILEKPGECCHCSHLDSTPDCTECGGRKVLITKECMLFYKYDYQAGTRTLIAFPKKEFFQKYQVIQKKEEEKLRCKCCGMPMGRTITHTCHGIERRASEYYKCAQCHRIFPSVCKHNCITGRNNCVKGPWLVIDVTGIVWSLEKWKKKMDKKTLPLKSWEFGEYEHHPTGGRQEIKVEDNKSRDTIAWVECYEGDMTDANLIVIVPKTLRALETMLWYAENPCEMPDNSHVCGPEGNCDCICSNWAQFQEHAHEASKIIAQYKSRTPR